MQIFSYPEFQQKTSRLSTAFFLAAALAVLSGCSDNTDQLNNNVATAATTTTTTTPTTAATLQLSASVPSVPSDNSATTTITVTALSATNAALSGIVVTLATDTGIVSAPTVTTGADGMATFTFSSGTASLANRTATITATAGASAQIPIQILGSTLTLLSTSATSVPDDGSSPVTVTFIAKNAQGTALVGTPYTATWAPNPNGLVTVSPASGVTDGNGMFTVSVAGVAGGLGTATVSATAAGSTAATTITVSPSLSTFAISQTTNNTTAVVTANPSSVAMATSDTLTVTVAVPATTTAITSVDFITTSGHWGVVGQTVLNVPVPQPVPAAGTTVSATLTAPPAGTTSVQVLAQPTKVSDSLAVSVTAKVPNAITLQAAPTLVPKSVGTTTGVSTLIATVTDALGQPVGGATVVFSLSNTTGGGETVSPVLAYTTSTAGGGLSLGQASATFTSGSLSSTGNGVQVRASVLGTAVATEANLPNPLDVTPSGNDAQIKIGGTAGSIAFGMATKIEEVNVTTYRLQMSVLVADVNGNPAANTTVTLSAWPIAWSTGTQLPCAPDTDTATTGTFYNEDANENLILDSTPEDGVRKLFATGALLAGGSLDGQLTPINSAGGTLPGSVQTDANGLAVFYLTYLKSSAIWTVDRIRASAVVQGSEAVSQFYIRLPALQADASPICYLSPPYSF